jgi:hypothetical protein
MLSSFAALAEVGVARAHNLLSRVWYILYYHRTSYSYLTFEGRGELLDGGGEKRRSG